MQNDADKGVYEIISTADWVALLARYSPQHPADIRWALHQHALTAKFSRVGQPQSAALLCLNSTCFHNLLVQWQLLPHLVYITTAQAWLEVHYGV